MTWHNILSCIFVNIPWKPHGLLIYAEFALMCLFLRLESFWIQQDNVVQTFFNQWRSSDKMYNEEQATLTRLGEYEVNQTVLLLCLG